MNGSFANRLDAVADISFYPEIDDVQARWGQLLREGPDLKNFFHQGKVSGALVPLRELGRVKGGVVTRANSYFIVREVPYGQIPARYSMTRRDLRRFAVVVDGLGVSFKIERDVLRPVIKGPEALATPTEVRLGNQFLFDVRESKECLRAHHANGALAYIKRGETVAYKVSEDSLKGGIPAKRSNIKNRKPYWYSLSTPDVSGPRIVLPEHYNNRYLATLVDKENDAVVIDKCYVLELCESWLAQLVNASLNSSLSWYQLELRGRTPHGEGVLEVKIPDLHGLLVVNPLKITNSERDHLMDLWAPLATRNPMHALAAVVEPDRVDYDTYYQYLAGATDASESRLLVERELRAAILERHTRTESVAEEKSLRAAAERSSANVSAYVSRVAVENTRLVPDPRHGLDDDVSKVGIRTDAR